MPDSTAPDSIGSPVPRRSSIPPGLSRALDVSRGLAALAVVVQHARTYLFADLNFLRPQPLAVRAVYFLTGFGHAAVMVFFVLSGFLVGGSALAAIEEGRFSWRRYLLQRGTRLWIVLIPALALTALWDRAGLLIAAHPATLALHARSNAFLGHPWTVEGHGLAAFAGNALFLMNFLVPTFGSNGSLWSLANEFTYYILFPLAAIAVIDRRNSRRALIAVVLFALLAWSIERDILEWGAIWLMGTAVARAPRLRLSPRAAAALALGLGVALVGVLAYDRVATDHIAFATDALVGALLALALYALRCTRGTSEPGALAAQPAAQPPSRVARPFLALAGFGYTLYLVHEPPLALLREWIIARPHHRWAPSPAHLALGAAIVMALVAYAYALSRVTEARTDHVRAWLQYRLASLHPSLAPAARAAQRVAEATEGFTPSPTWQTLSEG